MKEEIVITIENREKKLILQRGEDFFGKLLHEDIFTMENCGGRGVCGRCKIQFLENAPLPTAKDRRCFTPQKLREGFRLACLCKPVKDSTIRLFFETKEKMFVLQDISEGLRKQATKYKTAHTFVIVDLGTTTIVMQLVNGATGQVINSFHCLNPQRKYGADVVTRMEAAMEGEAEKLSACVREALQEGLETLGGTPSYVFVAGNTVMEYLFLGYDVKGLAKEPFTAENGASVTTLGDLPIYFLPRISAFVGGDIFAGIYATLGLKQEKEEKVKMVAKAEQNALTKQSDFLPYLLIDLGTNGELALVTEGKIYVTATAAGPAFEGGANAGVYGSDMVELVANLLENKVIDKYGTFSDQYEKGIQVGEVFLTQEDIRTLQLAKAAVRAGIECLLNEAGLTEDDIGTVYLAGGFGYKLKTEKAAKIGLLPSKLISKTVAVGNTALAGAFLYGCSFLNKNFVKESLDSSAQVINLAKYPGFQEKYIEAINLCM